MTAFLICLIVAALLMGIAWIKCGVRILYENKDFLVELRCLGSRYCLLGGEEKTQKKKKKVSSEKKKSTEQPVAQMQKRKINFRAYLPYWQEILGIVGRVLTAPTIDLLRLQAEAGGSDAEACAMAYGRMWAAVGAVLPVVENIFQVEKREISILCNYEKPSVEICAEVRLSLRVYEILALACAVLIFLLRLRREMNHEEKAVPKQ